MNIASPVAFEVSVTNKEDELLGEVCTFLSQVCQEMETRDCTILEWEDSGAQISLSTLDEITNTLDTLRYVNTMF